MAPMDFQGLPLDIKALILDYIIRPTDMKTLCLVSKHLCSLMTPQLYRRVVLDIGGPPDQRVPALLSPDNRGLYHIRALVLEGHSEYDERQAFLDLRLITELLPRDILHSFSWDLSSPIRVEDLLLLYQRQKELRNIKISRTDQPFFEVLTTRPLILSTLKLVEVVDIYATCEDSLCAGQKVLETYRDIDTLHIHMDPYLRAPKKRIELVTGYLFSHMVPFESCTPIILRKLNLFDLDLKHAATTLLRVIDFSRLEILTFRQCTRVQAILEAMTKRFTAATERSNLYVLYIDFFVEEERHPMDSLDSLDRLLMVLTNRLTDLRLYITEVQRCPSVEGIIRQASSLKKLIVVAQDISGQQIAYSAEEFARICSECICLEQLSLSFPPVTLGQPAESNRSFWSFVSSTRQLLNLHTLNITSWPLLSSNLQLQHYEAQLQLFAQRIFESNDGITSKLAVLAIGTNGCGNSSEDDGEQNDIRRAHYFRDKQAGIFGQTIVLAKPTTACLLKYTPPDSDLLRHYLFLWNCLHPAVKDA
ncbi:MAG: hypothetical protein M1836_002975 [Candelina mexicana]|nr:MAG: hypothetical protein M1836_002975 [Candelina mexicana]